jgi:lipid-binding SYLF domain-containing protein
VSAEIHCGDTRGGHVVASAVAGAHQEVVMDNVALQSGAAAALTRLKSLDPGLDGFLEKSHAYAVFPSVG